VNETVALCVLVTGSVLVASGVNVAVVGAAVLKCQNGNP
jgi:hypothetical protein